MKEHDSETHEWELWAILLSVKVLKSHLVILTQRRGLVRVRSVCYVLPEVGFGLFKDDLA